MNFEEIWQRDRKFLAQVFGGFSVFLIVFLVLSGSFSSAIDTRDTAVRKNDQLRQEVGRMLGYSKEIADRAAKKERLEDLLDRISTRRFDISAKTEPGEFKKARDELFTQFSDRARRVGLTHPDVKEVSFDTGTDLTAQEWQDKSVQLEMLGRILNACIDGRVRAIDSIEPEDVETEEIPDNEDVVLVRYPISLELRVGFADLPRLLAKFQSDESFLSTELVELKPAATGGRDDVTATVRFSGLDLGEPRESEKRRGSGGFSRGGGRGGR